MTKPKFGESQWDKPTCPQYNPNNIEPYHGKTFISGNGTEYRITEDGRFSGRDSIEGAEVMLIAGLDKRLYMAARACLGKKAQIDNLISAYGQEPRVGLDLVVSLTYESSNEKGRNGIIIPTIKEIR